MQKGQLRTELPPAWHSGVVEVYTLAKARIWWSRTSGPQTTLHTHVHTTIKTQNTYVLIQTHRCTIAQHSTSLKIIKLNFWNIQEYKHGFAAVNTDSSSKDQYNQSIMPFYVLQWCDKFLWFIFQNKRWCVLILGTHCCESFTTGIQTQAFFRSTQSFLNHLRLIRVIDCKKSFLYHLWQQLIAKSLSYTTCV